MRETEWEPCDLGICAANKGHDGTCVEASGWTDDDWYVEPTPEERAEWAAHLHSIKPAKFAQCPDCYRFSAHPWQDQYGTQDGTFYAWGGVCKTHGAWSETS